MPVSLSVIPPQGFTGPADRQPAPPYVRTRDRVALEPPRLLTEDGRLLVEGGAFLVLAGESGFYPVQFLPGLVEE